MAPSDNPRPMMTAPGELDEACLLIHTGSGDILQCNAAASELLGMPSATPLGAPWNKAIHFDSDSASLFAHALQAGRRVVLPPVILCRPNGTETAVGGLLSPWGQDPQGAIVRLLLWPLPSGDQLFVPDPLPISDTLAVLGVDQLRYDVNWGAPQTASLMADIRESLLEIVRSGDTVGPPSATTLLITLRDVDIEGARDICRAVLSHLHRVHTQRGSLTADARICIGLSSRRPGASALATLLAANNALLQAQQIGATEPIRAASAEDGKRITGAIVNYAGIFSEPLPVPPLTSGTDDPAPDKPPTKKSAPPVAPIEKDIEGYVVDNMEGAVDQAIFLAHLDIPVAIIGPAGTGKMYVARIIHEESGGANDMLVSIDGRDFRSRAAAHARIAKELAQGEGKTLVFKSPHLMHAEVQFKLAKQISSRTLADVSPPRYLPQLKMIALFPDKLEVLVRRGELVEALASAFAGYPINVPPIKDRKQAVLRWAHKILGQEGVTRDRDMKGFTPDAEQAMLMYNWPGNISEMRQCIHDALEKTDKDWLTPVDLGLFTGINPDGAPYLPEPKPFLSTVATDEGEDTGYIPSVQETLHVALGEAVHSLLELNMIKPLGAWLEDDLVLAALDRYRGDLRRTGEFLHTKPRNISRWLPKIALREDERNSSALWQKPRRLVREWVRESPQLEESPLLFMADTLMAQVNEQGRALGSAARASIMGVSTPTYLKRCKEVGHN
jgi:DNA-binding NtrC family response regulator/GGDEF domain-containing protein